MTLTIQGRIKSIESDSADLAGFRVEVFYAQELPQVAVKRRVAVAEAGAANRASPGLQRLTARTDAAGRFVIRIPDTAGFDGAAATLRVVVWGPAGQLVKELSHDVAVNPDSTDREETLVLAVSTKEIALAPLEAADRPPPATRRITGRVLDRTGKAVAAGTQVLVFGRKPGVPEAAGAGTPILAARTDGSGYFFGDAPNEAYERAAAVVAGIPGEYAISLLEGQIPGRLPLLVEIPEDAAPRPVADPCEGREATPRAPTQADIENAPDTYSTDLGVGRCVQFNTPNRAIEEFDFYSVVRTTEPDIVGYTTAGDAVTDPPPTDTTLSAIAAAAAAAAAAEGAKAAATAAAADAQQKVAAAVKAEALSAALSAALKNDNLKKTVTEMLQGRRDPAWGAAEANRQIIVALTAAGLDPPTAIAKAATLVNEIGSVPLGIVWSNDGDLVNRTVQTILDSVANVAAGAATAARAAADAAATKSATAAKAAADSAQAAADAETAKNAALAERAQAIATAAREQLEAQRVRNKPPGRDVLNRTNPIDWDDTPTFYQAAEIAHGHLLHFKQVWYADGYSLGDLLYSLPLAPGQKKLVSVVDWERRERTERAEDLFSTEGVRAGLSRDRDLGEVVTGALTESSRGGSKSTSAGVGAGTGAAGNGSYEAFNFGALVGVSGGYGQSDSGAWQESARDLSSSSLQTLRDRTLQSASAVRGLRSSVVHTVAQGEAVRGTTEVIANHNHCHAMTVQYFEVLRHLKLVHELADVQECLFVPLPMGRFDLAKALRWRQPLQTYLLRRDLAEGFEAARRVRTNWIQSDAPSGRYADEGVRSIAGELLLTVTIPMPPFPERPKPKPPDPADTATAVSNAINPTDGAWGVILGIASGGATLIAGKATEAAINLSKAAAQGVHGLVDDFYAQPTPQERYDKFQAEIMPGLVEAFVDQLELWALLGSGSPVLLKDMDFTLVSTYQPGIPLTVSLRGTLAGQIRRGDISQLILKSSVGVPTGCRAIVNAATIRYRTAGFEHSFVDDNRVNDDIDPPKVTGVFSAAGDFSLKPITLGTGATLFTPLDAWEQKNPRIDDKRLAASLVEHLNDNLEYYHHAIWWTMDPNRRYMLLDGYYAPGSGSRSVASVVENRMIGIVGNSLVLPVARGVSLNPRVVRDKKGRRVDLKDFYQLKTPVPAARVSLPTRGVFAEAILGNCNSCEEIDDTRFWRWEDSPIDEPPAINPISTDTRRAEPASTQPSAFPTPIVSIQNAPAAPDPAGVAGVLSALGKQSFADITGLAGTQANAAAAYGQALDTAYKFGKEASTLAQQAAMLNSKDRAMGAIDKAEAAGQIDAKEAKQMRVSALKKMVGDAPTDAKAAAVGDRLKVIDEQAAKGAITAQRAGELREQVLQGLSPEETAQNAEQQATTDVIRNIPSGTVESIETKDPSGATTKITAQPTAGTSLQSAELSAEVAAALARSPFYREETSANAAARLWTLFAPPAAALEFSTEVLGLRLSPAAAGGAPQVNPERSTMRYAVAALAGPSRHPLVGWGLDEMLCVAAIARLALLYAAYRLRADVDAILSHSGIGVDASPQYTQDAIDAVTRAFLAAKDPALRSIARTPAQMPVLERMFAIQRFLAHDSVDRPGKLEFIQGAAVPADEDLDQGPFEWRLERALKYSDNDAATSCIADIGLPYIKALLSRSGFADISGPGKGLWLGTTYGYFGKLWPTRADGRSVTAGVSERACTVEGSLEGSGMTGQGGTARAVATFYLLLQQGELVSKSVCLEMQKKLQEFPERFGVKQWLIDGLEAGKTVEASTSKMSILNEWNDDSALIISHAPPALAGAPVPTTPRRTWIAVVLLSKGGDPIVRLAPELERAVENYMVSLQDD